MRGFGCSRKMAPRKRESGGEAHSRSESARSRILSGFFQCFCLPSLGQVAIVLAEQRPYVYRACNTPPHRKKGDRDSMAAKPLSKSKIVGYLAEKNELSRKAVAL